MNKANIKINKFLAIYATLIGEGEPETITKADHEAALAAKDAEINKLSETKTTLESSIADTKKEFEALKASKNLTAEEREQLENRLGKLSDEKKTTEHQLNTKIQKLEKDKQKVEESLTQERDAWKKQFTSSRIERDITDAAVKNKAFVPNQLVSMLSNQVRLEEVLDDEGKSTGKYISKIKYTDVDKDGKQVELDLPISDAVSKMKESENFANLFDDGQKGGPGHRHKSGEQKSLAEIAKTASPEEYRAARKANK